MYIILRLICEILSRIAVTISFLWGHKHGVHVYATASFAASVIHDINVTTCKNIFVYEHHMYHSGAYFTILHCCGAFAPRKTPLKPKNTFKQTCVNFF